MNALEDVDVLRLYNKGRLFDLSHRLGRVPTAEEANEWSENNIFGHDAINCWIVLDGRCEDFGIVSKCDKCDGDGEYLPYKSWASIYEGWQKIEPPTGDGYQLWEDVSEGSPVSPVFETLDDLREWMYQSNYSEWQIDGICNGIGWVPSMILYSTKG